MRQRKRCDEIKSARSKASYQSFGTPDEEQVIIHSHAQGLFRLPKEIKNGEFTKIYVYVRDNGSKLIIARDHYLQLDPLVQESSFIKLAQRWGGSAIKIGYRIGCNTIRKNITEVCIGMFTAKNGRPPRQYAFILENKTNT